MAGGQNCLPHYYMPMGKNKAYSILGISVSIHWAKIFVSSLAHGFLHSSKHWECSISFLPFAHQISPGSIQDSLSKRCFLSYFSSRSICHTQFLQHTRLYQYLLHLNNSIRKYVLCGGIITWQFQKLSSSLILIKKNKY